MISLRARLVKSLLRLYTFPVRLRHGSLSRSVKFSDAGYEPEGMDTQARICGGVRIETLVPPGADGLLIHFHGGGHTTRMNDFYRRIAGRYALAGFVVHSIDYEAGADKRHPALLNDCLAAVRALAAESDISSAVFAGDSMGANLMLSSCLRLRDEGMPMPAALVAVSPFADLTASGDSYRVNCHRDPMYALPFWQSFARHEKAIRRTSPYAEGRDPRDPYLSPAFADFSGFPPLLVQCGGCETSASDALMLAGRFREAGAPVKLTVYKGMFHDFQYLFPRLPESRRAWDEIYSFLRGAAGSG